MLLVEYASKKETVQKLAQMLMPDQNMKELEATSDPATANLKKSVRDFISYSRIKSSVVKTWPKIWASIVLGTVGLNTPAIFGYDRPTTDNLQSNEFEIIFNSPLPHEDVRIGDTIYTYGSAYIYKTNYQEYLQTYSFLESSRVRFKVSKEEVDALKSKMESELGKNYVWAPYYLYFSCVSATQRAIKQTTSIDIPTGIGRDPALTKAWLKAAQLLGDSRIQNVYFTSDAMGYRLAQFSIDFLDAAIFTNFLPELTIVGQLDHFPNSINFTSPFAHP